MSIFALSDLHLSFGTNKSMDIFSGWENYTERIEANWKRIVKEDDTVILAGDTSWGIDLEESFSDFSFLNRLPGRKILIKGNHDYWWTTVSKMQTYFIENGFETLEVLHNDCKRAEDYGICGTRGWMYDGASRHDEKVIARECGRLDTSISKAKTGGLEPIVFLHYPPFYNDYVCVPIIEILKKHNIQNIYYGHIHGAGRNLAPSGYDGIKMRLISCDCVDFTPIFIA